jgi:hypothetical protein
MHVNEMFQLVASIGKEKQISYHKDSGTFSTTPEFRGPAYHQLAVSIWSLTVGICRKSNLEVPP